MGLYILYAILIAIGLLFVFMIIRTLIARPKKIPSAVPQPEINESEIVNILSEAIKIPTVTKYKDGDDQSSFPVFHEFLKKTFPEIFSRAKVTVINNYSLVIVIEGEDKSLMPGCFLAHQDVVPATPEGWETDPFGGTIKDGYVYGRGSQDMKSQLVTALYGLEILLRDGKEPLRSVYYCFGHDEEATGKDGARNIVAYLKEQGIRFAFVIDEGGTILDGKPLGIKNKLCLIGTCEKGYSDFILTSVKDGGHASSPKKKSSVDAIADAIHDLRRSPMKTTWSEPLKLLFKTIAPYMNPLYKFLFVNRDILDFGCGIGRTARATATAHHLIIGDVVAHIQHFFVFQSVTAEKAFVGFYLHRTTHVYVGHAQPLITLLNRLGTPAGNDCDVQPHLDSKLNGITVLDIDRTHRTAVGMQINGFGTQYAVYVKDYGFYFL